MTTKTEEIRITGETTVNEAVRRFPATLTVFGSLGIDSCCGGTLPIAEAGRRHGADVPRLLAHLNEVAAGGSPS